MSASVHDGDSGRGFQEAVSYAVGHRVRVEILTLLHERESASAIELSRELRVPLSTITYHIGELLKSGSIEISRTEKVRSVDQHFYGIVNPIYATDEELAAMPEEESAHILRTVLQSIMAEVLAAFWAGTLTADPRVLIMWSWFNVDEQGRAEIADEQARCWERVREIEKRAASRCAKSGEEPVSIVVAGLSFERARTAERFAFATGEGRA